MKGSEKQIKWAEDIIAGARKIIADNIQINQNREAEYGVGIYSRRAEQWEKLSTQIEEAVAKCDDAAIIINKRNMFSYDGLIKWVNRM